MKTQNERGRVRLCRMMSMAVLGAAMFLPPAHAGLIEVTFNGVFYNTSLAVEPTITEAVTTYSATLVYDDSVTGPNNFTPTPGDYFDVQIGSTYHIHVTPDSYQIPGTGFFIVNATIPSGTLPLFTDPVTMQLKLAPDTNPFFNPNHLPDTFVGLDPLDRYFSVNGGNANQYALANVENLTAGPVPEPATCILLGSVLLAAGLFRRRISRG